MWQLAASVGGFRSDLTLDGAVEIEETMVTASVVRRRGAWSARATVGAIVDGELRAPDGVFDVGPGGLAAVGVARQWAPGPWFVTLTGSFGASVASTDDGAIVATDLRVGAMAGVTVAGRVSPYAAARGFGGPVFWRGASGSDDHHYQLGGGVAAALPGGVTVLVDVSALGERALSIGASYRL